VVVGRRAARDLLQDLPAGAVDVAGEAILQQQGCANENRPMLYCLSEHSHLMGCPCPVDCIQTLPSPTAVLQSANQLPLKPFRQMNRFHFVAARYGHSNFIVIARSAPHLLLIKPE
jgi:hypothetical protein